MCTLKHVGIALAAIFLTVPAQAGRLKAYWTKDAATKDTKPPSQAPNQWNAVPPGGGDPHEFTVTLAEGEKIWIAFCNEADGDRYKFFKASIMWDLGDGIGSSPSENDWIGATDGFETGDDDKPVKKEKLKQAKISNLSNEEIGVKLEIRFTPQPEWERIELTRTAAGTGDVEFDVRGWSKCSDVRWIHDFPKLVSFSRAEFGAPDAMIAHDPRITEVLIFPDDEGVDHLAPVTMVAPAETGVWTTSVIWTDPDGVDRPQGGVSCTTDGPGLGEGDEYSLSFSMLDQAAELYQVFALDESGDYFDLTVDVPEPCTLHLGAAFEAFCHGNGGVAPGCTSCPCGNDAPGDSCGGCLNGAGTSAHLSGSGSPSLVAETMRFELMDASPGAFAILISGDLRQPFNPANPCAGLDSGVTSVALDGLRCVGAGVIRHGTRATDADGHAGVANAGWGAPDGPSGGLIQQGGFAAGQTRHFHVFYRDDAEAHCGTAQNTTNAVSVTLLP